MAELLMWIISFAARNCSINSVCCVISQPILKPGKPKLLTKKNTDHSFLLFCAMIGWGV